MSRAVLATALAVLVVAAAAPHPAAASPACDAPARMPGVGLVCPADGGLYEVLGRDGSSLGFTHGPDPVPSGPEPAAAGGARPPVCAEPGEPRAVAVYAVAFDDLDRYGTMQTTVRDLVEDANALFHDSAARRGRSRDLVFACTGGVATVHREVLPTRSLAADFSTIVEDLRARGYTDPWAKYWVFYDDTGACTCGGTGHVYNDDRPGEANLNNGNAAAMFAVTFGHVSTRIMLHEGGHNLGAVQNSAPHSSGAHHCNDGRDTMCYADGGPRSAYTTSACGSEVWDCGNDDYFDPAPPAGSYLATRWNIGSWAARFVHKVLEHAPPVLDPVTCAPEPTRMNEEVVCTARATDDSGNVSYRFTWGDGITETTPPFPQGVAVSVAHTYAASGAFDIVVKATDDGDPPLSASRVATHVVDHDAPVLDTLACAPSPTQRGIRVFCTVRGTDDSDLHYVVDYGDGTSTQRLPAVGHTDSGTSRTGNHIYASAGDFVITATATDAGSPPKTSAALAFPITVTECAFERRGELLFGLQGVAVEGVSAATGAAFQAACADRPFALSGASSVAAEVEVCWLAPAGSVLRCDDAGSGTVPAGAQKARVVLRSGALASYALVVG